MVKKIIGRKYEITMKLKIFYSWQSDLPNSTNRGFISKAIEKSAKQIYRKNNIITEYYVDSDSRDETGTPDLVANIFSKIDQCDIFIADISIINSESNYRKCPNPNVLLELGYACSRIGWEKILCLYNTDYGKIEDLPFDIRSRKPIAYSKLKSTNLGQILEANIQEVIDNHISNKKYYAAIKREIDLGLQAILIDITKMLYFKETPKCYDYNFLLHMSIEVLKKELFDKKILGFQIFKNKELDINDFISFFNDQVNMHFLNLKEKNSLARIIIQLKELKEILSSLEFFDELEIEKKYSLVKASEMNRNNPPKSLILIENLDGNKGIVLDSGEFENGNNEKLLTYFAIKRKYLPLFADTIYSFVTEINGWTRNTGNFFIHNERLFKREP